jgi:hypothetical protein
MQKFTYEVHIQAQSKDESRQKLKSILALADKLTTRELTKLEHIVLYEPDKHALAKQYLGL